MLISAKVVTQANFNKEVESMVVHLYGDPFKTACGRDCMGKLVARERTFAKEPEGNCCPRCRERWEALGVGKPSVWTRLIRWLFKQ